MKKGISYLFLAGILFASACSSKTENKESTETPTEAAPATEAPMEEAPATETPADSTATQ
ncbi:MAG: hypothetical protein QM536_06910 [Chitinophagaceae bacterium]|nr:hypothetical protein [Chitinophagaceae bacterium]